jgi:predicted MPP superfamily phosphohydrolase
MNRLITITIIWLLFDIYLFQAIKTVTSSRSLWWAFWVYEGLVAAIFLYYILTGKLIVNSPKGVYWGFIFLSLLPKLIVIPFLFLEDIVRTVHLVVNWSGNLFQSSSNKHEHIFLASRKKFISQLSLGIALVPIAGLVYGMIKGKYDYTIHRIKLKFADLPDSFNGFTITQLSDIHCGSFDSKADVQRGVDMANQQNSDLLLFTGDLVNTNATEMDRWMDTFSVLKAPFGKFSILGNHDYGDYKTWESIKAKANNLQRLKEIHSELGFHLMLNESLKIEKSGQCITLIGVENWGKGRFQKYGDLNKAMEEVGNEDFKILMSHDPSHWEAETLPHSKHVHLTLAGHTHGMQFGIEIPGFKWSPIKYVYPQWAGIYSENNKYLYVNRGFGFLAYPGRVGILPEITVITLEKG